MKKFAFFIIFLFSANIKSNCNFVLGDYVDELDNPSNINLIEINVPKSSKYAKNVFEIISSSQGSNTTPSVKALRNGGFIVTWNEQLEGDVNGLVSTIKARIFDSVGNATTGDLLISDGVNGINLTNSNRNYKNPSVIELNNGNLVIGFECFVV